MVVFHVWMEEGLHYTRCILTETFLNSVSLYAQWTKLYFVSWNYFTRKFRFIKKEINTRSRIGHNINLSVAYREIGSVSIGSQWIDKYKLAFHFRANDNLLLYSIEDMVETYGNSLEVRCRKNVSFASYLKWIVNIEANY